jgi:hypothetical protein
LLYESKKKERKILFITTIDTDTYSLALLYLWETGRWKTKEQNMSGRFRISTCIYILFFFFIQKSEDAFLLLYLFLFLWLGFIRMTMI